jgi:hypothetical protein
MRWAGHVAHMEETRNAYKGLGEKSEWKRYRHKCQDNIKM